MVALLIRNICIHFKRLWSRPIDVMGQTVSHQFLIPFTVWSVSLSLIKEALSSGNQMAWWWFFLIIIGLRAICVRHYPSTKIIGILIVQPNACHHIALWLHLRQTLRRPKKPGCLGCAQITHRYLCLCHTLHRSILFIRGSNRGWAEIQAKPLWLFCVRVIFDIYLWLHCCTYCGMRPGHTQILLWDLILVFGWF